MGDRCYFTATVHNDDLAAFNEILGSDQWEDKTVGLYGTEITDGEANYGYYNHIHMAAEAGLRFYGYSGSGDHYPPLQFAGFEGVFASLVCDQDGNTMVPIEVVGVLKAHMDEADLYFLMLGMLQNLMDEIDYAEAEEDP